MHFDIICLNNVCFENSACNRLKDAASSWASSRSDLQINVVIYTHFTLTCPSAARRWVSKLSTSKGWAATRICTALECTSCFCEVLASRPQPVQAGSGRGLQMCKDSSDIDRVSAQKEIDHKSNRSTIVATTGKRSQTSGWEDEWLGTRTAPLLKAQLHTMSMILAFQRAHTAAEGAFLSPKISSSKMLTSTHPLRCKYVLQHRTSGKVVPTHRRTALRAAAADTMMPEVAPKVSEEGRRVIVVGGGWAGKFGTRGTDQVAHSQPMISAQNLHTDDQDTMKSLKVCVRKCLAVAVYLHIV